jgi:antitoxin FitA
MSTLYIRDVPDEVAAELKERAARSGTSLSAYVNIAPARIAATPSNAELVRNLRTLSGSTGPSRSEILETLRDERG